MGVFFCTQLAQDIPDTVLAQLGNRVQHVLRAYTPNDAKALKDTVKTYPKSQFYAIEEILTQMGIGQALITVLNEKGIPTAVAHTHLTPPQAIMGPLHENEYVDMLNQSEMFQKYAQSIDPESAYEILNAKIQKQDIEVQQQTISRTTTTSNRKQEKTVLEEVMSSSVTKSIGREIVRGIFGMIFGSKRRR